MSGRLASESEITMIYGCALSRLHSQPLMKGVNMSMNEARMNQLHDPELFRGTERFFRPGYAANLITSWIPSLDGMEARLRSGARVADVGCGHGASTILMAKAFRNRRLLDFLNRLSTPLRGCCPNGTIEN